VEIGPALAEARTKAGLTVADVSERTRIRRAIISDIERDDYSACGGDFYARGHIRAIAKVVGTDPVQLIDEYDENVAARSRQEPQTPPDPRTWWQAAVRHDPHGWRNAVGLPAQETQAEPQSNTPLATRPQPQSDGQPETLPQSAVPPVTRPQPLSDAPPVTLPQSAVPPVTQPLSDAPPVVRPQLKSAAPLGTDPDTRPRAEASADPAPTERASRSSAAEDLLAAAEKMRQAGAQAVRRSAGRIWQLRPERSHGDATRQVSAEAVRRSAGRIWQLRPEQFRGGAVRQVGADLVQGLLRMRTAGRRLSWITGAIVILLAGLIAAIYALVSGPGPSTSHATMTQKHATTGIRPVRTVHTARSGSARPSARPSAQPPAQPSQRAVPVTPVSATAFGPGGRGQGDNPQLAALAIGARSGSGWQTNWYTTAKFGGLQAGTGLLLDLGKPVTVSSVRIVLGPAPGGALELRAGNAPVLSDLRPVSRTAGTGGTLTLDPGQPVRARYLLIWFTRLPPDSSGTYQATIYHVTLTGTG
jgi:transcriptional regulator with XRE-family HTH domain